MIPEGVGLEQGFGEGTWFMWGNFLGQLFSIGIATVWGSHAPWPPWIGVVDKDICEKNKESLPYFRWYFQLFHVKIDLVLGHHSHLSARHKLLYWRIKCKKTLKHHLWLRKLGIVYPFLWPKSGPEVLQRHKYIKTTLQIYVLIILTVICVSNCDF